MHDLKDDVVEFVKSVYHARALVLGLVFILVFAGILSVVVRVKMAEQLVELVQTYEPQLDALEERVEELQTIHETNKEQEKMIEELRQENRELYRRILELEEWIDQWNISYADMTKYAPLHPDAIEGMCYAGDPNITASGARVEIGRTIAAGPSVPFGTLVLVEGYGIFEVQDRGGLIYDGRLDMAVASRSGAFRYGRQEVKVAYRK